MSTPAPSAEVPETTRTFSSTGPRTRTGGEISFIIFLEVINVIETARKAVRNGKGKGKPVLVYSEAFLVQVQKRGESR